MFVACPSPSTSPHRPAPSPARVVSPTPSLVDSSTSCVNLNAFGAQTALRDVIMGRPHSPEHPKAPEAPSEPPKTPTATYASPLQKSFLGGLLRQYYQPKPTAGKTDAAPDTAAQMDKERSHVDSRHANMNATTAAARTRTFRPQKSRSGTQGWQLKQFADATLGSGSLRKAVKLPEGEDRDEWLAVNVVDFYNQINLLYGSITEFCSPQSCPEMKATDEFEYLWQDSENFKRPTKMPAPQYIEHLMAWCQSSIDNEQMFPSRIGVPFPKQFGPQLRNMVKRLYRVYAHIYCHHYPVVIALGLEPHLNTSFKHYVLFINEHDLVTGKDFWGPLGDLVDGILSSE